MCVDMKRANVAIARKRQTPTNEEMLYDLNGATVFSKVDLKLGFLFHVELEEEWMIVQILSINVWNHIGDREISEHNLSRSFAECNGEFHLSQSRYLWGRFIGT